MHKMTFFHATGNVVIGGVDAQTVQNIIEILNKREIRFLTLNGHGPTSLINIDQVTNATIEPPLP